MSETMYMKKLTKVVSDNNSGNNSTKISSNVEDTLEDTVFSDPDNLVNSNTRTKIQYDLDINGAAYKTDLGSIITRRSKLTLRDLGTHMSERMLKSMSQDNVNLIDPLFIGWNDDSKAENILKNFSSEMKESNWYAKGTPEAPNDLLNDIEERYGDYVSNISDWQNYGIRSPGIGMGDANVLNPPFQFNELDDIRSDIRRPKLGRMYSEEIYDYNMPIVYFQPGTISVDTAGIKLASSFVNNQTLKYQDYLRGEGNPIKWGLTKFGNLMQSIISFGAKIILDSATWYKWTPTVFRYMRFVNEIILELAAWMGLLGGIYEGDTPKDYHKYEEFQAKNTDGTSLAKMISDDAKDKSENLFQEREGLGKDNDVYSNVGFERRKGYMGGVKDNVLSVLRILPQFRRKIKSEDDPSTDDDTDVGASGWPLAMLTIPFAIDKGASSSESFSNSTQEHPIRQQYNSMYESSNEARMTDLFGNPVDTIAKESIESLSGGFGGLKDWALEKGSAITSSVLTNLGNNAQNFLAGIGLTSEAGMVATGLGRFLLPEVWTDSQFDKSYSISMKLRSPYGHRLSIFENEYVPLSFAIGLSAPRKIGIQSYTNPFYVRAYSKGLFSIPMGMITSLSITRGEDSNDRTVEGFFRTTSIQLSIKDMMPNVAMGLDGGIFSLSKATNLGMENYLCTLAGIDFIERASIAELFKNKWERIKNMARSFNLFGERGSANRSNLWMLIARGTIPGKFMSRTAIKLGKSENPFATRKPKSYY